MKSVDEQFLKDLAVIDWGYTEDSIPKSFSHYEEWIQNSKHLPLNYLADERKELRADLKNVFPEFQSALVFLFSYHDMKKWMLDHEKHDVAAYTLGFGGGDYHYVLKERLVKIADHMGLKKYSISLDIQPVLERDLALRAGLGWFGKNSMLIHRDHGSYFMIGSLLLSEKMPFLLKPEVPDHCGTCTACIDACPTTAIDMKTRTLIAEKCISTFTIEIFKDAEAPIGFDQSRGEIFGCDICQDVCPWNKKSLRSIQGFFHLEEKFSFLHSWLFEKRKEDFLAEISLMTKRGLKKLFSQTAFDRPGRDGWIKNLKQHLSRKSDS